MRRTNLNSIEYSHQHFEGRGVPYSRLQLTIGGHNSGTEKIFTCTSQEGYHQEQSYLFQMRDIVSSGSSPNQDFFSIQPAPTLAYWPVVGTCSSAKIS